MAYKIDISNVAYSQEYKNYRNGIITKAYNPKYKTNEEIFENNDIKIITEHYLSEGNMLRQDNAYCGYNKIYNKNNELLHDYFNIYDQSFFCDYIKFSNGFCYIFYREDLYGYSVFDINNKNVFNYYPLATFKEQKETFIGIDIHYNINNNIFAINGCYWACPYDVFLIKIDDPMKEFTDLINIHEILDPGYEKYDDIEFVGWENNDIKLKIEDQTILILQEEEYKNKMIRIE
jgi:hypothetical protein